MGKWVLGVAGLVVVACGLAWWWPDARLVHTFSMESPASSVVIDTRTGIIAASSTSDDVVRLWRLSDKILLHTLREL
jgi:hypothetical protein